jgi:cytochrome c peroxidase
LALFNVTPVDPGNVLPMSDPKVVLGQMLFFEKALSGNGDISCATCHHPSLGTSDGLALPIGVGGNGLGPHRELGPERGFIPRNSPDIWNRGSALWQTMFWDGRVHGKPGYFGSPAGLNLPEGLDSVLSVQAMFPVTSAEEMRGHHGENEIADMEELPQVWAALTERILGYEGYPELFRAAYPDVEPEAYGFQHIANAIAAFEVAAFTKLDSPFDRYIAGDNDALSEQEKRGAELFFGKASCGNCHNGPLLTDQGNHVIAAPQLGPGKGDDAPYDMGRFLETGDDMDRYAFRTPPLRNVELTAPYTHSGAYRTLADVIRHHIDPSQMLDTYRADDHVDGAATDTWLTDDVFLLDCTSRISSLLAPEAPITDRDIEDLVAFLLSLTDPSAYDMSDLVPSGLISGLEVDRALPSDERS